MKPAFSIVVFTVLSGGGLGLAAMLAVFVSLPLFAFAITALLALGLTAAGLAASTLHLANPKNAWRSFSRIKTSWLSREAVAAAIFFPLFALWAFLHWLGYSSVLLRIAVFASATITVFCTAMIYQSLKPIAAWRHPLTAFNYLMFAAQVGTLLYVIVASFSVNTKGVFPISYFMVGLFTVAAVIGKLIHYWRIGAASEIRVGRAIGFTQAQARLLDAGHTAPAFLNREFIFHVSATKLRLLRRLSMALYTLSPLVSVLLAVQGVAWAAALCTLPLFGGLFIERWLFFAEARHVVRAFHGLGAP